MTLDPRSPSYLPMWRKAIAIALVSTAVVAGAVALHWTLADAPSHPEFAGDYVPEQQLVCVDPGTETGVSLNTVAKVDAFYGDLGWPEWPSPVGIWPCPQVAPTNTVMWRIAADETKFDDLFGGVDHHWERNAKTVYLRPWPQIGQGHRWCAPRHEGGHARNIIGHAPIGGTVMSERCGIEVRFLDRTDPDHPYNGDAP